MAIDPTISLRVEPPPQPRSITETILRFEALREARQTRELRDAQMENVRAQAQDRQRTLADEAQVKAIVARRTDPRGKTAWSDVVGDLNGLGLVEYARKVQKDIWDNQGETLDREIKEADAWLKRTSLMQTIVNSAVDDPTTRMAKTAITKIGGPELGGRIPTSYGKGEWKEELGALSGEAIKSLEAHEKLMSARKATLNAEREGNLKDQELFAKKLESASGWLAARSTDQKSYDASMQSLRDFGEDGKVLERFPTKFTTQDALRQIGQSPNEQATSVRLARANKATADHQAWLEKGPQRDLDKRQRERPLEVAQKLAAIYAVSPTFEEAQEAWKVEAGPFLEFYKDMDVEWANRTLQGFYRQPAGTSDESWLEELSPELREALGGGATTEKPAPTTKADAVPKGVADALKAEAAGTFEFPSIPGFVFTKDDKGVITRKKK